LSQIIDISFLVSNTLPVPPLPSRQECLWQWQLMLRKFLWSGKFCFMTTTLSINQAGQIELPESVRLLFGVEAGTTVTAEVTADRIEIVKKEPAARRGVTSETKGDLVDWLLSCPEKGWLEEARDVQTTSDIKPLAFE